MMGKWRKSVVAIIIGLALAGVDRLSAQTVSAVPQLDLTKFSGVWYEIAHLPNKREKRCAGNGQMLFALGDKARSVQLVTSCKTTAGYTDARNADGKSQDKLGDGKLKLGFWPFYRKFWVLALEPDYQWALVGSPNHKDLWIYARKSGLAPETLAEIKAKAAAQGFSLDKLITVPQGLE